MCDNLAAINAPASNEDKVFSLAQRLDHNYRDFGVGILVKPFYPR